MGGESPSPANTGSGQTGIATPVEYNTFGWLVYPRPKINVELSALTAPFLNNLKGNGWAITITGTAKRPMSKEDLRKKAEDYYRKTHQDDYNAMQEYFSEQRKRFQQQYAQNTGLEQSQALFNLQKNELNWNLYNKDYSSNIKDFGEQTARAPEELAKINREITDLKDYVNNTPEFPTGTDTLTNLLPFKARLEKLEKQRDDILAGKRRIFTTAENTVNLIIWTPVGLVYDPIAGVYHAATNPKETAKGLYAAVTNPGEALKNAVQNWDDFENQHGWGVYGRATGNVVSAVGGGVVLDATGLPAAVSRIGGATLGAGARFATGADLSELMIGLKMTATDLKPLATAAMDTAAGAAANAKKIIVIVSKGEPVNISNGEYIETWEDFLIPGTLPFNGSRYMGLMLNLPTRYTSPLGACQISAFDEIIVNPSKGMLTYITASGEEIGFERPFNFLQSKNPAYPGLALTAPWRGKLDLEDGRLIKRFRQYPDKFYRLEAIETLDGQKAVFKRNHIGILERIEGPDGLTLIFGNDAKGRRISITLIGADRTRRELARYGYDTRGRMISADCAYGMSVRYIWRKGSKTLASWHNLSKRTNTVFTYDAMGRVIHTETSGSWNNDRFEYDEEKRQTAYIPAGDASRTEHFEYDADRNITAETNALGAVTRHDYDANGRRVATTDANGNATQRRYDDFGNIRSIRDGEDRETFYNWGTGAKLLSVVDSLGNERRFDYDARSRPVSFTTAEGHVTRFGYDDKGRLQAIHHPDGYFEKREYDDANRLIRRTDPKGTETAFSYDVFGRVVAIRNGRGGITKLAYEAEAGGFAVPTTIIRPDGVTISRRYDSEGTVASVTDGEGRQWTYEHGAFGVLKAIIDPKGGRLVFDHDSEGRLISVTNARGQIWRFERDVAGQVIAEEDYDGRRITYAYDPAGQLIERRHADAGRQIYIYDRSGLLTREESFEPWQEQPAEVTRYWYDERGLLQKVANNAATIVFERDRDGRILSESVNGRAVESLLDAKGNRIGRRIGEGLVRLTRDPLGLVASLTIGSHKPLSFERDAAGRETLRESAAGFRLDSTYDPVGQLLKQVAGFSLASLGVGVEGARLAQELGIKPQEATRQVERNYGWDKAFSPLSILDSAWGETGYGYDSNGQVAQIRHGDHQGERFRYDAAHDVIGFAGGEIEPWRQGSAGISFTGEQDTFQPWQTTPGGKITKARGPNGETVTLSHDLRGRVIERRVERNGFRPKSWIFTWDAKDRLVSATTPERETWRYGYDPFGRRAWKIKAFSEGELRAYAARFPGRIDIRHLPDRGATLASVHSARLDEGDGDKAPVVGVSYCWDGNVLAEEAPLRLDGSTDWHKATKWHYEPESFRPLAKETAEGDLLYIVTDHLGTPREMFSEDGILVWAAEYRTWGDIRRLWKPQAGDNDNGIFPNPRQPKSKPRHRTKWDISGPEETPAHPGPRGGRVYGNLAAQDEVGFVEAKSECPIRFQGQWEDDETGLYYNRFRYYDPLAGQYMSPDPIGIAGGTRPQGYVENPNGWIDPLGLAKKKFALGLEPELRQFSKKIGAESWKDYPDKFWKDVVSEKLWDPNTQVHFNLDGVDVNGGLSRAATGAGGATDWELLQIYQMENRGAGRVQFWRNGSPVESPF